MGSAFAYCEACGSILPIEGQRVCGACKHKQSKTGLAGPPSSTQFPARPGVGFGPPAQGQAPTPSVPPGPPTLSPYARQAQSGAANSSPAGQNAAPGPAGYGAPGAGQYGAPTAGQYSAPGGSQYGAPYGSQTPPASSPGWAASGQNQNQPPLSGQWPYGVAAGPPKQRSMLPVLTAVALVAVVVAGLAAVVVMRGSIGAAKPTASALASPTASPTPEITPPPVFALVGRMTHVRANATATTLKDGRVLIAGGWESFSGTTLTATSSAEIYDPTTKTFTATGSMTGPRASQDATLLADGRVLLSGGSNGANRLKTAEIYDPKTSKFTATGSMNEARIEDSETLLAGGRVLVVGGYNKSTRLATAEIYDPVKGVFTKTGSMASGRGEHAAGLLKDGRVIGAGGDNNDKTLTSAEIYDPSTGKFTPTGSLSIAREYASGVVLPNGRFLVLGGDDANQMSIDSAEIWDPTTGKFTQTGTMISPRGSALAVLLQNGTVLVVGGWSGPPLSSTEVFDPATGVFTSAPPMSVPRAAAATAVLFDGSVLVCGGWIDDSSMSDSADVYGTTAASGASPSVSSGGPGAIPDVAT